MNDPFAHMRPFRAGEVPDAIQFLLNALDWESQLSPFLGTQPASELVKRLKEVDSVESFQEQLSKAFIDMVLERTAGEVTFDFSPEFEGHGALFISNHRDIVLDPALINRALLSRNEPTTQIGIGSNLLETPWVEKLVRLNKSFIVRRGGTPREQLLRSEEVAAYVREVILNESASVWLAHREGRAKNGDDRTSPALMRMLLNGEEGESWNQLKVQPVSLSYEWDPCDGMKVRELLIREMNNGDYEKSIGEDERSMKQGLFGWKGGIHVAFCEPVVWESVPEGVRPAVHLAERMDDRLHRSMKVWPSQHWAASEWLNLNDGVAGEEWPKDWMPEPVSEAVKLQCEQRLKAIYPMLGNLNVTEHAVRKKWCEITMNPLVNRIKAERETVVKG